MQTSENIVLLLRQALEDTSIKVLEASELDFAEPRSPGKWSRKLILGHLCDSAHNNLRRFVVGQYQPNDKIIYDPDAWVAANAYHLMTKAEVLHLWVTLNRQICRVLENMSEEHFEHEIDTGKDKKELHTLAWLARDYWAHMHHHLEQLDP